MKIWGREFAFNAGVWSSEDPGGEELLDALKDATPTGYYHIAARDLVLAALAALGLTDYELDVSGEKPEPKLRPEAVA